MKKIFTKSNFPQSPGGNIYYWKEANTSFEVSEDGKYIIAITASGKNAAQNGTSDDDDLRVKIDDYEFGKEEVHQDTVTWYGFGVAAAWDGASLKGGSKTVYFFLSLLAGQHTITFIADETPTVESVTVFKIEETASGAIEDVVFTFNERAPGRKTDAEGIPWKSFVFAPGFNVIKLIDITALTESAKQKGGTDGDNIKVHANGQIVHNPKAPTSDKYKNFFFSGDLSQGKSETFMIDGKWFLLGKEDYSLELWYDETPVLQKVKIELNGGTQYNTSPFGGLLKKISEATHLTTNLYNDVLSINSISNDTLADAQQYAIDHGFNGPPEDNEPDAFRHVVWNVRLTRAFGEKDANIITSNHEIFWMEINEKQELSRAGVMDMWNNLQGREYAIQYSEEDEIELFHMAKDAGKLILTLNEVTDTHRKIVAIILSDLKQ